MMHLMQWTPVDLETIAKILDDLSVESFGVHFPDRLYAMLDAQRGLTGPPIPTPTRHMSTPTPCACSPAYCASESPSLTLLLH